MNYIFNKKIRNKLILFLIFILFFSAGFSQNIQAIYKSVGLTPKINLPVPGSEDSIPLSIGELRYEYTYYKNTGKSYCNVSFDAEKGMHPTDKGRKLEAKIFVDINQNKYTWVQYEDTTKYTYYLPSLTPTGRLDTIRGYPCQIYVYITPSIKIEFWFSKKLDDAVAPGIYYKDLGGIVKSKYTLKNKTFSYVLIGHKETKDKQPIWVSAYPTVQKAVIHPSFEVK